MPQKTIILDNGTSVLLSWNGEFHGLSVAQNGAVIASFGNGQDLIYGKKLILPDQQTIIIKVANRELEAWHNGKELISKLMPGQTDHFSNTIRLLYSFGTIGIGGFAFFFDIIGAVLGSIFISMALLAKNNKKKTPFWIAAAASIFGLVSHNFILVLGTPVLWYYLYQGITATSIDYTDQEKVMQENTPLDYF